jgi:hypothetical protein
MFANGFHTYQRSRKVCQTTHEHNPNIPEFPQTMLDHPLTYPKHTIVPANYVRPSTNIPQTYHSSRKLHQSIWKHCSQHSRPPAKHVGVSTNMFLTYQISPKTCCIVVLLLNISLIYSLRLSTPPQTHSAHQSFLFPPRHLLTFRSVHLPSCTNCTIVHAKIPIPTITNHTGSNLHH